MHLVPFRALLLTAIMGLPDSGASASPAGSSAPPDFRDAVHLPNGCFVSTFLYLEKFRGTAPTEHCESLVVVLRYSDGRDQPHTLALVSWRGAWWLRDEHFGVFPLGAPATLAPSSPVLRTRAKAATEAHSLQQVQGGRKPPSKPTQLTFEQRLMYIVNAAHLIGSRAQIFLVDGRGRRTPLLFFRPRAGEIAVYDPAKGTATGPCDSPKDVAIVRTVAMQLGYATDRVSHLDGQSPSRDQFPQWEGVQRVARVEP